MKTQPQIFSHRELNRKFSRAVQACMVDGYDIDGERNDYSNMTSHAVMVHSERGKKDTFRLVKLTRETSSIFNNVDFRILTVTEYSNAHDLDRKGNGKEILCEKYFRIGTRWRLNKCAWTKDEEFAKNLFKLHLNRQHANSEVRGHVLDMTDKTTRNLVLALVRRRGERCKSVGADNIVSANIGLNLYNGGPIRVNAVVKRGDRRQEVTIAARKATNYGKTSPKILDACARIHGEDRTHAISRLIRQS